MNRKLFFVIIIGAFLLQPFLAALFPVWLVPNLILCILVVMAAVMHPEDMVYPMILIFVLALLQDIYYSQFIGVTVISLLITMLVVVWIRRLANIENIIFVALISIVANIVYCFSYWTMYALLSSPYSFMYMLRRVPQMTIANIVVVFVSIFIISRDLVQRRRDEYFR